MIAHQQASSIIRIKPHVFHTQAYNLTSGKGKGPGFSGFPR